MRVGGSDSTYPRRLSAYETQSAAQTRQHWNTTNTYAGVHTHEVAIVNQVVVRENGAFRVPSGAYRKCVIINILKLIVDNLFILLVFQHNQSTVAVDSNLK